MIVCHMYSASCFDVRASGRKEICHEILYVLQLKFPALCISQQNQLLLEEAEEEEEEKEAKEEKEEDEEKE